MAVAVLDPHCFRTDSVYVLRVWDERMATKVVSPYTTLKLTTAHTRPLGCSV